MKTDNAKHTRHIYKLEPNNRNDVIERYLL